MQFDRRGSSSRVHDLLLVFFRLIDVQNKKQGMNNNNKAAATVKPIDFAPLSMVAVVELVVLLEDGVS